MRFHVLAVLLAAGGGADPAAAAPRCTPGREGEVACLDGRLCACRHDPGGSLTGRRAGTRWDCGVLRPACGPVPDAGQPPAERPPPLPPMPYPPPEWR